MDNTPKRKLKVKTISQQIFDLEVPQDITIADLKKEIFTKSQVPIDRQRLIFLGKALLDNQKLSEIIKEDDQTIHLMAITNPQQPQQQPTQQPQNNQNQAQQPRFPFMPGMTTTTAIHFGTTDGQLPPELNNIFGQLLGNSLGRQQQPQPQQQQQQQQQQPQQQQQYQQPQQQQQQSQQTTQQQQQTIPVQQQQTQQQPQAQFLQNQRLQQQQQQQQQSQSQQQFSQVTIIPNDQININVQLPNDQLQSLQNQLDNAYGNNLLSLGQSLPQINQPRNNITVLGQYLHQLCFLVQRALPVLQVTSDILIREPYLTSENDRRQTQQLCRDSALIVQSINRMTNDLFSALLRFINLGNAPGQFQLNVPSQFVQNVHAHHHHHPPHSHGQQPIQRNQNQQPPQQSFNIQNLQQPQSQPSQQPQQQQQQQTNSNQQQQSTNNSQQQQQQQNLLSSIGQLLNTISQTQSSAQQIQVDQQGDQIIIDAQVVGIEAETNSDNNLEQDANLDREINNLVNNIMQMEQQISNQQPAQEQQQQSQEQQEQNQQFQQPQAPPTQQIPQLPPQAQQMMSGLLGNLGLGGLGGLGGDQGGANFFSMTLQELMMQNYANQMEDGEVEILQIFSGVKVGDLMGAQLSGNYGFLDGLQGSIKENLHAQIAKFEGRIELIEKLANSFLTMVVPKGNQSNLIIEGFDPRVIASEVLVKHIKQFFQIIEKDYTNSVEKFSDAMVNQFYKMIGETTYEVSEGLVHGLEDYKQIISANLDELFRKSVGAQVAGMFGGMLSMILWQFIQKSYNQHKLYIEQQQAIMQQEEQLTEEQLLKEINEASSVCKQQNQINFSDQYRKGDPNYREFD